MTDKLSPCPFCGGAPKLRVHRSGEDSEDCYVECPACEVRTTYYEDAYAPVDDAVAAWNRRTPPPETNTMGGDETLRLAVAAALEADREFRSNMMPGWEGDPLSDEIDGLRRVFEGSAAPQTNVPCPCTLIEQDEDCPIGYPSMICGVCKGTGNATPELVTALAAEMMKVASDMGEPEDPFAAWESIDLIKTERDHFHNQWRACWAPLTPRSENEKQGFERVLAILKSKLSDGGGIVGRSDVQQAHNDFYRGRKVAFEECATMLRAALATTEGSAE